MHTIYPSIRKRVSLSLLPLHYILARCEMLPETTQRDTLTAAADDDDAAGTNRRPHFPRSQFLSFSQHLVASRGSLYVAYTFFFFFTIHFYILFVSQETTRKWEKKTRASLK